MTTYNCGPCDAGDQPLKVGTWRVHFATPGLTAAQCSALYLGGIPVLIDDDVPYGRLYLVSRIHS